MNKEIKEMVSIIKAVQDDRKGEAGLNKMHRTRLAPLREDVAIALYEAGYRRQSELVKEFAEKLKTELFANCVLIKNIHNPQKEDMDSVEAFQIIDELAEQHEKAGVD